MAQIDLSPEDYRLILEFQKRIFSAAENYAAVALRLFKELFHGNLAVYSKWSDDLHMNSLITLGLSENFMREAHDRLLADSIYGIYTEQLHSNDWKGLFYSQDQTDFDTEKSELFMHLRTSNINYFATMVLSVNPREHFLLFKTQSEGPFSEREKTILQYIRDFLSSYASIRNQLTAGENALLAINRAVDLEGKGRVIIDEQHNVVSFNETLLRMIPREEKCTHISSAVRYLIRTIENNTGVSIRDIDGRITTSAKGYQLTAEEMALFTKDKGIETFFVLTASPGYTREIEMDYAAIRKYLLTDREAQIAELIIKGYPNKLIADNLHLSLSTVKVHISNIFRKLGVHNRTGIVDKLTT